MGLIEVCMDLNILCVCVSVCVRPRGCICFCCCAARPDGSPRPGGTALVNNSDEAHYQSSADLSLIPP